MPIARLSLHDCNWKVGIEFEQVVGAFLLSPARFASYEDDLPIGESALFIDGVRRLIPTGGLKLWNHKLPAGVSFVIRHAYDMPPVFNRAYGLRRIPRSAAVGTGARNFQKLRSEMQLSAAPTPTETRPQQVLQLQPGWLPTVDDRFYDIRSEQC